MREAYIIRDNIEKQLTQHFQAQSLSHNLPTDLHFDQLSVAPIQLSAGHPAASVGNDIADSVFNGISSLRFER